MVRVGWIYFFGGANIYINSCSLSFVTLWFYVVYPLATTLNQCFSMVLRTFFIDRILKTLPKGETSYGTQLLCNAP